MPFNNGQADALFLFFGFDDADGFAVHKEDVIGRSDLGKILPHGHADTGIEVELVPILNLPAGLAKQMINLLPRLLFRFHMTTCGERLLELEKLP